MTAKEFAARKKFIERKCIYGESNFCDGTVNRSISNRGWREPEGLGFPKNERKRVFWERGGTPESTNHSAKRGGKGAQDVLTREPCRYFKNGECILRTGEEGELK